MFYLYTTPIKQPVEPMMGKFALAQTAILTWLSVFALSMQHAQAADIIRVLKVERTDSHLVVSGIASALPAGTKLWVQVETIDGAKLGRSDPSMEDKNVHIQPDHTFSANLSCEVQYSAKGASNACGTPPFPDGKYQLLFSSYFNSSWQTVAVLKAVGVTADKDGHWGIWENPTLLPTSPDLRHEEHNSRTLQALRTVTLGAPASAGTPKFKPAKIEKDHPTGVRIGMTTDEVEDSSWGKPRSINRTIVAGHVHEQWVYGGGLLYFDNGVLTAIQN
jgi:hypothetical protein